MNMKAAVWTALNQISIREVPVPEPGPDDVLVKVMSAGVCMTDLHVYTGAFAYGEPPHILGHEIAGEVCETGSSVTGWKEGERVTIETSVGCGKCGFCLSGQRHLCKELTEIGFTPNQGGYAQYVSVPAANLIRLPDAVTFDEAGILESVVCPVGALYRLSVGFSDTAAVFGVGPAGIAFIQGAKAMGAKKVIAVARDQEHLERARFFGADVLVNTTRNDVIKEIMKETEGIGADMVMEAAGAPVTIAAAALCARKGGRIILYGLPEDSAKISYPVKTIIMNQLSVHGAVANPMVWKPLLDMIAAGKINLKDMVTHRLPLSAIHQAFDILRDKKQNALKIVIHPWDER